MKSPLKNQSLAGLLFLLALLFVAGCKCSKVDCQNGICSKGSCLCDYGWEGDDCSIAFRDKFLGTWSAQQLCNSGVSTYSVTLTASSVSDLHLTIANLYNTNESIDAEIVDQTQLSISSQSLGGTTVTGDGEIDVDSGVLQLNYTLAGFSPVEECGALLTK